jgi:hypothetical protein
MTTMLCFRICLVLLLLKVDYILVLMLLGYVEFTQNEVEAGWRNHKLHFHTKSGRARLAQPSCIIAIETGFSCF